MKNARSATWWMRYPEKSRGWPRDARPDELPDPRLAIGTSVRLLGKPEKLRKVLHVEWHRYRQRYVYELEVSGSAYWFSDQLLLDGHDQPIVEAVAVGWWQRLMARFGV